MSLATISFNISETMKKEIDEIIVSEEISSMDEFFHKLLEDYISQRKEQNKEDLKHKNR